MFNEREALLLFLRELLARGSLPKGILAKQVLEDNFSQLVQMVHKGQEIGEIRCDIDPAILSVVLLGTDVFFFMEDVFRHFRDVYFAEAPGDYRRL